MAVPIPIIKRRIILNKFFRAGAIDIEHAIDPADIGVSKRFLFKRIVSKGLLIDAGDGKYYIDTKKYGTPFNKF